MHEEANTGGRVVGTLQTEENRLAAVEELEHMLTTGRQKLTSSS
jgi:hypothetical protein